MRALVAASVFAAGCFSKPPAPGTGGGDGGGDARPPVRLTGGTRRLVTVVQPPLAELTRFPLHVALANDTDLARIQGDASLIAFATMQDEVLACDIVTLGTDGDLEAWVLLPTLPTTAPFSVQLAYGPDLSVRDACKSAAAWADYTAAWHLGDANPDALADSGPHGYVLSTTSGVPLSMPGIAGRATLLDNNDGSAEEACMPDHPGLHFDLRSFSYELWVRPNALVDDYDVALYKGAKNAGNPGFDIELGLNAWNAWIRDDSDVANERKDNATFTTDPAPRVGVWNHLVVVVDRAANRMRSYLNGVAGGADPALEVLSVTGPAPLCLGDALQPSQALVDEVRIREGVLSTAWVDATYRNLTQAGFLYISDAGEL